MVVAAAAAAAALAAAVAATAETIAVSAGESTPTHIELRQH